MIDLSKIVFILGITNILFLVLVVLTCRCIAPKWKYFRKIYDFHIYFLWIFLISVLLHAVLALIVYGNPFN